MRFFSSFFARFSFLEILSDSVARGCCPQLWPSDGFAICAVSRHGHFIVEDWTSSSSRNGANRKRLAIFPFQPLAVALLRLPSTINRTRVFPQPLATISNAKTRDRGLKAQGLCAAPNHTPWSRVCGVSLLAYDQGTRCTLLIVTDTRKSTTAEYGNRKNGQV